MRPGGKNKDIVLLKPDKGNGVVNMDRRDYDLGIQNITQDRSKLKRLSQDPTLQREGKLQRLLKGQSHELRMRDYLPLGGLSEHSRSNLAPLLVWIRR